MIVGYARTSTTEQEAGLSAQLRDLEAAGCNRVFQEQVSSVDRDARRELNAALDYVRDGDTLIVTKLDRLARSVPHLLELVEALKEKGATLRILAMDIDTGTPTGKLMVSVLGSVAAFEREIMLERQREGIAKAKAEGKYKGRKPTAKAKVADVQRLRAEGKGATEIAKALGIGRASVYRILAT
ncbi:recombinase family protein [Sulfitobacter pontiacus]|uniref:recombinase family protein n=1 Tax=Sulfitobacter pontiacus TaxID=60137 RepID=UPI0015DDED9A|nr:recombinase family protein [Sulfitobacter pontiacus]QLL42817.1 recombinase family protein [Sulfitobacter pontiacus]